MPVDAVDSIRSAIHVPCFGATAAPKREVLSETEAAAKGPKTAIPAARPRKPSGGPISSTTFPVMRTSVNPSTRIPARSATFPSCWPTRSTVLPLTVTEAARISPIPSRAGDVENLVVVDGDPLGAAVALDQDPRARARDDVLLDHERLHRVRREMPTPARSWTRLPVIRTWPGCALKLPAATTMPSVPGSSPPPAGASRGTVPPGGR